MQNKLPTSTVKNRSIMAWLAVYLKGMAMGAADIVPGVSGGTIAFISGIYEELILSLKACRPAALLLVVNQGFFAFWQHINGSFLLILFAGVVTSLFSLVKVITWAMATYPQVLWAFFFGLILASAWLLAKSLQQGLIKHCIWFLLGFIIAWWISGLAPNYVAARPLYVFFAGSIAICAMVLPGVSGSFLLLLMGLYLPILAAIDERNFLIIGCFVSGCVVGLLSFVHLLGWLLQQFRNQTFALLIGFLLGSLKMLWPWKEHVAVTTFGHEVKYSVNISPQAYAALGEHPVLLWSCLLAILAGVLIIVSMHFLSNKGQSSL